MAYWSNRNDMSLGRKLRDINWGLVLLITVIASLGFTALYSAAGGDIDPWADRQMARFVIGIVIMVVIAVTDIRVWMRLSYVVYALGVILLIAVELVGRVGMGAQRWLDLGVLHIQPSEIMKIALVLTLARYFHGLSYEDIGRIRWLVIPLAVVVVPVGLVIKQPDLGTAMLLLASSGAVFFFTGVRAWKFLLVIAGGGGALPIAWNFLHDYQKRRVFTFMNPEEDPLGSGYHILQSKIALGSGGFSGKGFMQGTQSHLSFLPEKQTDFIFTMFAEEHGLIGALVLIALYILLIAYGYAIALRSRSQYGRLLAGGLTTMLFLYVFINIAMVSGLVPVVGVPLPLFSYGGTAMMTLLVGIGLLVNVYVHRDVEIPRHMSGL
ncbi:rod shape-determining protein RodA [Ferrovibrio sp.]|uniref:rod shape-determining protein RodA n=1 Tax=Ferrovibrio sp. TaxID=1917215 RepID=UPI000CC0D535|nr:rod shape-determining protein RodA [Ferrovibrio sp.]PJI42340.1 MAG: rod shape-determining protein RodA [Ferrovibrio sp.]